MNLGRSGSTENSFAAAGVTEEACSRGASPSGPHSPTDDEREESLLPALEAEMALLPAAEKEAYLEACRRCPAEVDYRHKKAFLFVEKFDPKLAAQRMSRHWQYKLQLFGPKKCFLPMTLAGAMSDDLTVLSEGALSLLPVKDMKGRSIIYAHAELLSQLYATRGTRENVVRSMWYLLHISGEDPYYRRCGFIFLLDATGHSLAHFQNGSMGFARILNETLIKIGPPIAFRSIHLCRPHPLFHIIGPVIKFMHSPETRKRLVVHYGPSPEHLRQSLEQFGFDEDRLPQNLGGNINLDMVRWLSARMVHERVCSHNSSTSSSLDPDQPGPLVMSQSQDLAANGECSSLVESSSLDVKPPSSADCSDYGSSPDEACDTIDDRRIPDPQRSRELKLLCKVSPSPPLQNCDRSTKNSSRTESSCAQDASATSSKSLAHSYAAPHSDTVSPPKHKEHPPDELHDKPRRQKKGKNFRDPRMERAVEARMADPDMALYDALVVGGFTFPARPDGQNDRQFTDCEGTSLHQRKNQLCRRLRERRKEDPRIALAAAAKRKNPELSLLEALSAGGFQFPDVYSSGLYEKNIFDADKVTLASRKKQLVNKLAALEAISTATARQLSVKRASEQVAETVVAGTSVPLPDSDVMKQKQNVLSSHEEGAVPETNPTIEDGLTTEDDLTDWDNSSIEGNVLETTDLSDLDVGEMMDELSKLR